MDARGLVGVLRTDQGPVFLPVFFFFVSGNSINYVEFENFQRPEVLIE